MRFWVEESDGWGMCSHSGGCGNCVGEVGKALLDVNSGVAVSMPGQ